MNAYHLKIIYPGMSLIRDVVKADYYIIFEGGYHFRSVKVIKSDDEQCVYPLNWTIIERIEYNTD